VAVRFKRVTQLPRRSIEEMCLETAANSLSSLSTDVTTDDPTLRFSHVNINEYFS